LAVVFSAALVLGLTLSSQFVYLLTVSTISRLLVFAATCLSMPRLRRIPGVPAARFLLPGGLIIPGTALVLIAWLIASSSWAETRDVTIMTLLGALLYGSMRWQRRRTVPTH